VFGAGAELHPTAARIEAMPAAERRALVVRLEELLSTPPSGGLPASAVRALRDAGHEIGFHTRTHDTLTTLGKDELRAALSEGRAELEQITGTALEAIAYPSGRTSEAVFAAAAEAGFKRGYTTLPDPVGPGGDPLRMGRVDPALHTAGSLHAALNRALLRKPRT
jgi:peptidoglycan/xylan/chitin deacetylase (PgdA/CDA1 family)